MARPWASVSGIVRSGWSAVGRASSSSSGMESPRKASAQRGSNCVPACLLDLGAGRLGGGPLPVGPVAGHGVEGVGDGEDAGPQHDRRRRPGRAGSRARRTAPGGRARSRPATPRNGMAFRISKPMAGWRRISTHSSSVSLPGLRRMLSGMPILPMSWSRAPRPRSGSSRSGTPQPLGDGQGVADHPLGVVGDLVLAGVERRHQRPEGGGVVGLQVAEGLLELGGPVAHPLLQAAPVALPRQLEPPLGEGPLDGADEVGHLGRLEEVVGGPLAQAVHRRLGVAEGGQHDDRGVGPELPEAGQQPVAPLARHLHVADDERVVLGAGDLQAGLGARHQRRSGSPPRGAARR